MAFKFVAFFALLAVANAGDYLSPVTYAAAPVVTKIVNPSVDAVATTQHNVVRSFGGTVSSYSKAVDTPYSSVRKTDTRINNNVYTPAVAKTVTYGAPTVYAAHVPSVYAAPAVTKTLYAAPTVAHAPAVYAAHAPTVYATPAVTKTVYAAPHVAHAPAVYAAPATYSHAAPATYSQVAPATYSHASPVVYSHAGPAVAKTVTYAAPAATTNFNHGPAATTYTHNAPGVSSYGSSQTVHYSPAEMVSHMNFDGFGTHWGF